MWFLLKSFFKNSDLFLFLASLHSNFLMNPLADSNYGQWHKKQPCDRRGEQPTAAGLWCGAGTEGEGPWMRPCFLTAIRQTADPSLLKSAPNPSWTWNHAHTGQAPSSPAKAKRTELRCGLLLTAWGENLWSETSQVNCLLKQINHSSEESNWIQSFCNLWFTMSTS